jgi:dienelactone hydrolase
VVNPKRALLLLAALVLGALPLSAQKPRGTISAADRTKLERLLADALASNAKADLQKLIQHGKKLEKRYSAESIFEALSRGPHIKAGMPKPRKLGKKSRDDFKKFGTVFTGLGFQHDGHRYQYAVDLPPGFKNKKPLGVLVDPGHGQGAKADQKGKAGYLGMFRNMARQGDMSDFLVVRTEIIEQVGAGGLQASLPEDEVIPVFNQFFRDLASRFAIDPNRIYVSGLSQTGFWTWYLGRTNADRFAAILPMGAVTWQVDHYLDSFSQLPVVVIHGDQDTVCPVDQPRKTCGEMEKRGYPVTYREIQGAAHDFQTWRDLGPALKLVAPTPRSPFPKTIAKKVQTDETPWCYWIRIDEIQREGSGKASGRPTASLSATVKGQRIEITSKSIKKLTVCLSPELVNLNQAIEIIHNKKSAFRGKAKVNVSESLAAVVDRADWKALPWAFISVK